MSPFESRFSKYLATGEYVTAEDARPKIWKKFFKNRLSQHDQRFHPDGFNPETDTCTFREHLDKTNNIDDLSAAEKKEAEANAPSTEGDDGVQMKLVKSIKGDYEKDGIGKKTGQTVDKFVKQFIDEAKADGFTVSEKSVDLLRQRMNGLKNTPASKAYEPRFDMSKESLYGYAEIDPSAKDAKDLSLALRTQLGWDFDNDDINAYIQAFRDMDEGKVPKLPDLGGKTYEPPMDTKWSGQQQALAAIFQKRPDLIRPYIVERLENAEFFSNDGIFHAVAQELVSGDYKKRTEPYDRRKEEEKRNRSRMVQDAAAAKYLKEC